MVHPNVALVHDVLFVALTRLPTRWGAPYAALLANGVVTMELFLVTKNLLVLLVALPLHGVCVVLHARDPRYFELWLLWVRYRLAAWLGNARYWRASSYSALAIDTPTLAGHRRAPVTIRAGVPRMSGSAPS